MLLNRIPPTSLTERNLEVAQNEENGFLNERLKEAMSSLELSAALEVSSQGSLLSIVCQQWISLIFQEQLIAEFKGIYARSVEQ
jgi:hypothetical protein